MNTRPAKPEDLDAVLELVRADEEHLVGRRSRIGMSDLRQWLTRIELDADTWIFEEDGRLAPLLFVARGYREVRRFHRRGMNRISLGADSENPTGAMKRYESLGMQVELEQTVFEKALA